MKRVSACISVLFLTGCAGAKVETSPAAAPAPTSAVSAVTPTMSASELERRVKQFAPADFDFDESVLAPWEKKVLVKLVQASDAINEIYWLQEHPQLPQWRTQLAALPHTPERDAALRYFDIMAGPWDHLDDNKPFLNVGPRPAGGGFYPLDMTKQEFEAYVAAHPDQKQALTSYFTIVRRNGNALTAVPYSQAYNAQLTRAAALLREAAALSQNATLSDFLNKRAAAFLSNEYVESDKAWMDIAGSHVEPTIGPYEVYDDELFGYKAAFESFIAIADPRASGELDALKSHMRELETRLPIEDRYKHPERGFESPIRVVDLLYGAGEARNGVQTIAYNLPNLEEVIAQKGSKKVLLRNVMHAKFDQIVTPIGGLVLSNDVAGQLQFQPWFINVLMHELAHGLGPQGVNKTLKERHSALEEAKADVTGLHNIGVLAERGVYNADFVRRAYIGHLADIFRSTRFGTADAHGQANLIQFNWLSEKGALKRDAASGKFVVDMDAFMRFNRELATEIMTIQATGDYDRAGKLLEKYGTVVNSDLQSAISKLSSVPVDINPKYVVLDRMKAW